MDALSSRLRALMAQGCHLPAARDLAALILRVRERRNMTGDPIPPFKGGQGRTSSSIRDDGGVLAYLLVIAACIVAGHFLSR